MSLIRTTIAMTSMIAMTARLRFASLLLNLSYIFKGEFLLYVSTGETVFISRNIMLDNFRLFKMHIKWCNSDVTFPKVPHNLFDKS